MARAKGFKSYYAERTAYRPVSAKSVLDALPEKQRQKRADSFEVLAISRREKLTLQGSVRRFNAIHPSSHITASSVRKWAGRGLIKEGGRFKPRAFDRMLRVMSFPTKRGEDLFEIRDSRTAAKISRYWNELQNWLVTGDASGLQSFQGTYFQSKGLQYRFVTDLELLEQMAEFGEFQLDSIYEHSKPSRGQ